MYYTQLRNSYNDEVLIEQAFSDIEYSLYAVSKLFNGTKNNKDTSVVLIKDESNAIPPEILLNLKLGD